MEPLLAGEDGWGRKIRNHRCENNLPCASAALSAHKHSQLCCVDNHEQPRRGESLFASTEQPVYRLEPSPEEREPRERWTPSLRVKRGLG